MAIQLYNPVARLPFDVAVPLAAEQNFHSDVRRGIVANFDQWQYLQDSYLNEAFELLEEEGQNFFPEFDDLPHIQAITTGVPQATNTSRYCNLTRFINYYYKNRNLVELSRPDPFVLVNSPCIDVYFDKMRDAVRKKKMH